jgi:monoamine oxidase
MPRTPLFRDVRKTLRFAAYLEATHTPTEEGIERVLAERFRWTRRRFLQSAAVAAAGVLVGAPRLARAASCPTCNDVIIVGAGISGLTCAYRLQQNGVQARVIEAATRVGGRMFSLRNHFPDGQLTELGGEFFDTDHRAILGLAGELGVPIIDLAWANGTQGNAYWFGGKLIPTDTHLIDAFRPVAAKIIEQIGECRENCGVDWQNHPPAGIALDRKSISQWLQENQIGSPIADILKVAYTGEYGLDPDQQSALNLVCLIGTEPGAFELLGESDERFHAVEGNDMIPQRLAQRLEREVELGTQLVRLGQTSDGRHELTVQRGATREVLKADTVVISLPFTMLRKVEIDPALWEKLPPAQRQAIRELGYGTNAKLICGFDRRVWAEKGYTGATFSDLGYQSCWETSRGQAGTHGLLTNFLGGQAGVDLADGSEGDHAKKFVGQVDKLFPGVTKAFTGEAVRFTWPTYPHTLGSYTCYKPGQYQAFAGAEGLATGGLHFCGEHTSSNYSGFMNGGVESGERVAREVLD